MALLTVQDHLIQIHTPESDTVVGIFVVSVTSYLVDTQNHDPV